MPTATVSTKGRSPPGRKAKNQKHKTQNNPEESKDQKKH